MQAESQIDEKDKESERSEKTLKKSKASISNQTIGKNKKIFKFNKRV